MIEIFMARLRPEFVSGERDRICHLFPTPAAGGAPATLRAYCGQMIASDQAELLDRHQGMPCVSCILLSPPDGGEHPVTGHYSLLGIA